MDSKMAKKSSKLDIFKMWIWYVAKWIWKYETKVTFKLQSIHLPHFVAATEFFHIFKFCLLHFGVSRQKLHEDKSCLHLLCDTKRSTNLEYKSAQNLS